MTLVDRIKEKCKEKKTTIRALERELGFGNGTISRWDINAPSYDKVLRVADFLQVSFNWIIFGKEAAELSPEEQKLIDLYRNADERGKRSIMRSAEAESMEQESSTSMIG